MLSNFGPPPVLEPTVIPIGSGCLLSFLDWKAKVELFEQLRREHEFGVGTIAGVAAKFGVHRRVVRRAIASALPPQQHYPEPSSRSWAHSKPSSTRCLTKTVVRRASSAARRGASVPGF